jgi:hypothetical protein
MAGPSKPLGFRPVYWRLMSGSCERRKRDPGERAAVCTQHQLSSASLSNARADPVQAALLPTVGHR